MNRATDPRIREIFQLLDEQHKLQEQWPYGSETLERDHQLSTRIRELCDELCPVDSRTKRENRTPNNDRTAISLLALMRTC
jgi:hypothetical protein